MNADKRGEDVTEDGACFAVWGDPDNGNLFYIGQGEKDRLCLTRFQAIVLGKELQGLEMSRIAR